MLRLLCVLLLVLPPLAFAQPGPSPSLTGNANITSGSIVGTTISGGTQPISITASPYNASTANSSSANTTAIQAAINAAISAGVPLLIPAPSGGGCYNYTAPLTINGNLSIIGNYVSQNWNGGINVPLGSPPLLGSVICPSSNGSDAIDITGTSTQVNISNIGINFQTSLSGTGDGINYIPTGVNQGLSGSLWSNIQVYGHDGNHYAYNLRNLISNTFVDCFSYGGGVFNLYGNSTGLNFGNSVFVHPYGQVIVGGTANGFTLGASQSARLNLMTFIRPQAIIDNISGTSPAGNPPTSSQYIWQQDGNVRSIKTVNPDFETNTSSPLTLGLPATGNDYDFGALYSNAGAYYAPAWGSQGIKYAPGGKTFTDTTSSGNVSIEAQYGLTSDTIAASSPTTYGVAATLYLAPPLAGNNVSITRNTALYTTGQIFTTSQIGASGIFVTGTTSLSGGPITLNANSGSNTVGIGTGSTTGAVSIGGGSNVVTLGSPTILAGPYSAAGTVVPTCNSGSKGEMLWATDITTYTFNATYVSGGSNTGLLWCNGANWTAH